MESSVSLLKLTGAMARHASHAHRITADNLSRADIPEATRLKVQNFQASLRKLDRAQDPIVFDTGRPIDLEEEMLSAAKAKGQHEAALAFWQSGLKLMRLAVGAPQG